MLGLDCCVMNIFLFTQKLAEASTTRLNSYPVIVHVKIKYFLDPLNIYLVFKVFHLDMGEEIEFW